MKVQMSKLSKQQRIETLDSLYTVASVIRGRDAMKRFLKDLLTPSERIMLGRRIMIARRLISGATQRDIAAEMGVGTDTVWRVEKWLQDQMPGYEQAITGLEDVFKKRSRDYKRRTSQSAIAVMKRKYPLHFLLVPWPKDLR
jgi:Trp operon repressor